MSARLLHVEPCAECLTRERVHSAAANTGHAIAATQAARVVVREGLVDALAACGDRYDAPAWHENRAAHERLRALGLVIDPWGRSWGRDGKLRRRPMLIWHGLLGRGRE